MNGEEILIPTKEEVENLLRFAMDSKLVQMQTIGELIGMKWLDSLMPKIKGEPDWGYEGLKQFFIDNGIGSSDTFDVALEKLK